MRVKQWHKPPMTGNGNHTTYKNSDLGNGLWPCFTHIMFNCVIALKKVKEVCFPWGVLAHLNLTPEFARPAAKCVVPSRHPKILEMALNKNRSAYYNILLFLDRHVGSPECQCVCSMTCGNEWIEPHASSRISRGKPSKITPNEVRLIGPSHACSTHRV